MLEELEYDNWACGYLGFITFFGTLLETERPFFDSVKFSLPRLSQLIALTIVPQISQASSALNALDDVIAFIAALIGLGICAIITLIYLLIKRPLKVFSYILLAINLGMGLFFMTVHWGVFVAFLGLIVLVFLKMRKIQRAVSLTKSNRKEIEST